MAAMSATVAAIVLAIADWDAAGVWQPEYLAVEVSTGHVTIYSGAQLPLQTITINNDGTATLNKADGSHWTVSGDETEFYGVHFSGTSYFACGVSAGDCRKFLVAEGDGTGALQDWGLDGMRVIERPGSIDFLDAKGRRTIITLKLNGA